MRARWVQLVDGTGRVLLWVGQLGLFVMMALTVVSIVGRMAFGMAVPDSVTLSEILMLFVILLPMIAVQRGHGHVAVELLPVDPASPAGRALGCAANLICALAFGIVAWSLGLAAVKAFYRGEIYLGALLIPMWPFRALASLAFAGLAIAFLTSAIWPTAADERTGVTAEDV